MVDLGGSGPEILSELADYSWLTSDEGGRWLEEFELADEPLHRLLTQLRKSMSAPRARLVADQLTLRPRAVEKFGPQAKRMYFTDLALQQATDIWIARYKASRIPSTDRVADYCCGIGGDLLALAERGMATGWDRAAEMAHLAEANLQACELQTTGSTQIGDVDELTLDPEAIWHLDPDRRPAGRRSTQLRWLSPGPELIERWLHTAPHGILKIAPATEVPHQWQQEAELEWISRSRECRQQVVWFGRLATVLGKHRATRVETSDQESAPPVSHTFAGQPAVPLKLSATIEQYIYDTDPALRAADLVGALASECELASLTSGPSYLTSDQLVEHPLVAPFQVIDQFPLSVGPLGKHLRARGIGRLEIKKRGVDVKPENLRKKLKLRGDGEATLLLYQHERREIAILAERCGGASS